MDKIEVKLADINVLVDRVGAAPTKEAKLFGAYQEFVLLFVGFILTGICGAGLTYFFDLKAKEKEQAAIAAAAQLQSAGDLFKDVSQAMSQRLRAMTLLAHTYSLQPAERASKLPHRWESYTNLLTDWNTARDYRRAMVRNLYGEVAFQEERNIHYAFRQIGEALETLPRTDPIPADVIEHSRETEQQLEALQKKIQTYYFRIAADLNSAKVGQRRPTTKTPELQWDDKGTLARYLQP